MFSKWANWFYMTPVERKGSAVLMIVLLLTLLGKIALQTWRNDKAEKDNRETLAAFSDDITASSNNHAPHYTNNRNKTSRPSKKETVITPHDSFYTFNPNDIPARELKRLGLADFLVNRVEAYRHAGGTFYKPEDVLQVYDMDTTWWMHAKRYMVFREKNKPLPSALKTTLFDFDPNTLLQSDAEMLGISEWQYEQLLKYRERKPIQSADELNNVYGFDPYLVATLKKHVVIDGTYADIPDLNTADTVRLKQLHGIGSYFARQIIGLREQLGIIASHEVLWSIPGIDSAKWLSIYSQTTCETPQLTRMSINHATIEELAAHPFISWSFAREIVGFRENFRPFISVDELEDLSLYPKRRKHVILPYLTI